MRERNYGTPGAHFLDSSVCSSKLARPSALAASAPLACAACSPIGAFTAGLPPAIRRKTSRRRNKPASHLLCRSWFWPSHFGLNPKSVAAIDWQKRSGNVGRLAEKAHGASDIIGRTFTAAQRGIAVRLL